MLLACFRCVFRSWVFSGLSIRAARLPLMLPPVAEQYRTSWGCRLVCVPERYGDFRSLFLKCFGCNPSGLVITPAHCARKAPIETWPRSTAISDQLSCETLVLCDTAGLRLYSFIHSFIHFCTEKSPPLLQLRLLFPKTNYFKHDREEHLAHEFYFVAH